MSRESRKVFSILITLLLLLRRVTIILIAFIVTLARSKERRLFAVHIFLVVGVVFIRLSGVVSSEFQRRKEKTDLSHTLDSQHIYSITE